MAAIDFAIDSSELANVQGALLALTGKLNRVTAVAMTRSAKAAQAEIRRRTPDYIENPTPWTLNSTFVKPARADRLSTTVGFKDYSSSGTPAAKYLQLQATGGRGRPKGYENLMRRAGVLKAGEFAIPTGAYPLRFNQYGNVSGSQYVQVLSRLNALREAGSMGNRTNSPRSRAARRERDYFVATINGHRAIWARRGGRSIVPVFNIVSRAPSYTPSFPVRSMLESSFAKAFPLELRRAVREQMEYNRTHS